MLTIYVKFNSFLELSDTTITVHNVEVFILLSFYFEGDNFFSPKL